MPPATVNSAVSRMMNGMYSATSVCTSTPPVVPTPLVSANGTQEEQRPARGDLAEVVVPEHRRGQRQDRDRQQHAGEGDAPPRREAAPVDLGGLRGATEHGQDRGRGEAMDRARCTHAWNLVNPSTGSRSVTSWSTTAP